MTLYIVRLARADLAGGEAEVVGDEKDEETVENRLVF